MDVKLYSTQEFLFTYFKSVSCICFSTAFARNLSLTSLQRQLKQTLLLDSSRDGSLTQIHLTGKQPLFRCRQKILVTQLHPRDIHATLARKMPRAIKLKLYLLRCMRERGHFLLETE
jgi:hypothetical protein